MTRVTASAPGKLILAGEHAAVYGHPALVAAIDPRLRVELAGRRDTQVRLSLPDLDVEYRTQWERIVADTDRWRAAWQSDRTTLSSDRAATLTTLALGETLAELGHIPRRGLALQIRSGLPVGSGLGSSAALAVTVAVGLTRWLDEPLPAARVEAVATEVERRQHGTPSGIDAGTVIRGGVVWARRRGSTLRCERVRALSPLLDRLQVYDSGRPEVATGEVVAAVRQRLGETPQPVEQALDRLGRIARRLRAILSHEQERADDFVDSLREAESTLESLGVVPRAVQQVVRAIEAAGGAAKVCGAGAHAGARAGCLIVYHPVAHLIDRWSFLTGWHRLPLKLAAVGVRVEKRA